MKINNNFLFHKNFQSPNKIAFKSNENNKKQNSISYYEVQKVLNDPLLMDCFSVELAKLISLAKANQKKCFSTDEFKDNVLKLFAFNLRAKEYNDTHPCQNTFYSDTMQTSTRISYDDYFDRQQKVRTYTQLDERIDKFSRYHKVDASLVLPELKTAFNNLSPEVLEILPDGLISNILKTCSCDFEDRKVFLNEDISIDDKIKYLDEASQNASKQQSRDIFSKNRKNDPKLLQARMHKIMIAQNVIFNLSRIEDVFNPCELNLLFKRNEKGRYLKVAAIGNFQAWLFSTPFEKENHKKLYELRKMVY